MNDEKIVPPSKRTRTKNSTSGSRALFSRSMLGGKISHIASAIRKLPLLTTPPPTCKRKHIHIQDDDHDAGMDDGRILPPSKRIRFRTFSTSTSSAPSSTNSCSSGGGRTRNTASAITSLPPGTTSPAPHKPGAGAPTPKLSPFEARRVRRSVLDQIDWNRIAEDVACNRRAKVYRMAVTGVLDGWVEQVVARQEGAD
ncbi:MAG: hypothetical protein Q9196_006057 [Gyalolechia fulgens]